MIFSFFNFFAVLALFAQSAVASITVTATNASNTRVSNGVQIFTWPISTDDGDAANDKYCEDAKLYPAGLTPLDPTGSSALTFTLSSSTAYGGVTRYVHSEITGSGTVNVLKMSDNATEYSTYSGDPNAGTTAFSVRLSDLCSVTNVGTLSCLFTPAQTQRTIEIRVGVTEGQTRFCTTAASCSTSETSAADYTSILIELPRCATLDATSEYYTDATYLYNYGLNASPGDGRARVSLSVIPPFPSGQYPYKSAVFLFERNTGTARTDSMTLSQAAHISEVLGGAATGTYTIDNLTNDITYNVQATFVNVGGFMTPPGPPNGATAAPQVTPSEIAGFLSEENACFIATATGSDGPTLKLLRAFRDQILVQSEWGRAFVQWYYGWSPAAAADIQDNQVARSIIQVLLLPVKAIAAISLFVKSGPAAFWGFFAVSTALLFFMIWWGTRFKGQGQAKSKNKKGGTPPIAGILIFSAALLGASYSYATEPQASQPYIDRLRADAPEQESSSESYTETLRGKASKAEGGQHYNPASTGQVQPYIDALKNTEKNTTEKTTQPSVSGASDQTHIDKLNEQADAQGVKPSSSPSDGAQPHLEAMKSGLELKPKFRGKAKRAIGIAVATGTNLDVSSTSAQANSFESVYRTEKKYNPTVDLYYEHYLFRDRRYGAFGPVMRFGIVTTKGTGRFTRFNSETDVKFTFIALPFAAGITYRAIQPRFIVPFGQLALVGIPFFESRNDDKKSKKGITSSYSYTVGVAMNMDWIARDNAWERYDEHGILHTSLFAQMQVLNPLAGKVDFSSRTLMAGLNFEF